MKSKIPYQTVSISRFNYMISNRVVLVEFGVIWCGRCRLMSFLIEPIIKKRNIHLDFLRIDLEKSSELQSFYNIYKRPTYLVFKDGEIIERIEKLLSQSELEKKINSFTNG